VDGVRWRSHDAEGRGDETVLFVHGLLASSATWKDVLVPASAGRPAIAVDLPGFGRSDRPWPFDYTVRGMADALLRFLDVRGIVRVALVGNSLGGSASMLIAAEHPERVAALVLVAPATSRSAIPWTARVLRAPIVGEIVLALANRPVVAFGLRHNLFALGARVTEEAIDDAWFPLTIPGTRRAALAMVRTDPRRFAGLETRIRVPTLLVWGAEDRLLRVREAERIASEIAHSRVAILPGAGHLPQREVPGAFSEAVARFLNEAKATN